MGETEFVVDRAVLPDAVLARARVTCRDGCIAAIDARPGGAFARRLRGTLLPGFVDLQVNGGGGHSCDEARPDALAAIAAASGAGGAVAFLPTLITAPWERLLAQVDAVARWIAGGGAGADAGCAEPLGLHVEGPFLTNPGAHDPSCFVDPEPARVRELIDAARGTLRLLTLACDRRGAPAAVTQLRAAGVTVAIGHACSSDGFAACIGAGARMVTHLFNAMGSLHHREPGVAGFALDDERVHASLIADGAHVHPAMVRNAFALLGADRTVLVSDAAPAAGMPDGDFTLGGRAVHAQAGVVRDAQGRLAGSALTMAAAARNFLAFVPRAGVWTLARVAAGNAAHVIGAAGFGAIAVGRRAAFTLLGEQGAATALRA